MAAVSKPIPGGGAPLGIDLEGGIARITLTRPAPVEPPEQHAEPAEDGEDSAPEADDETAPAATDR